MIARAQLPPPVRPGDRVGVAALSGKVDPMRLEAGLEALSALGYEPVQAENLRSRSGLFAGSDSERLAGFHSLASDETLGAIVFARGGYGVTRILPDIDWPLLAKRPRAYVGYSDLTPFLLQVVERLGLAAFHGPMVAADFARGMSEEEKASFRGVLAGRFPTVLPVRGECLPAGGNGSSARGAPSTESSGGGRIPSAPVAGPLLGGCLSMLVATLGTPYAPDLDGSILILEDLGEPLYRFDRMLTHLRLSGNLAKLRGLVVGHLEGEDHDPSLAASEATLLEQVRCEAEGFSWPIAWGLPVGHSRPNLLLPLGLWGRLDVFTGQLTIEPWPETD